MNPFSRWNIDVYILRNYGNTIGLFKDKGRYVRRVIQREHSNKEVEELHLKKMKRIVPCPPLKYFVDTGKGKQLLLFQLDHHTFYPVISADGKLYYVTEEGGREKKKLLFEGNYVVEKKGDKEEVIPVPQLIAQRTYEPVEWLTDQAQEAVWMYGRKSFWERHPWLISAMSMAVFAVFVIYSYQYFQQMVITSSTQVAPQLRAASELNYNASLMLYKATLLNCQITGKCNMSALPEIPPPPH